MIRLQTPWRKSLDLFVLRVGQIRHGASPFNCDESTMGTSREGSSTAEETEDPRRPPSSNSYNPTVCI